MHKVKKKNKLFILNNIKMVGDFNIKKFLTENQVTVASQRLAEFEMPTIYDKDGKEMGGLAASGSGIEPKMNELDVQDPQVTDSVKEFYELQQEMNTMKSRLKEMEARFKGFEGVIKPMLDEMKELGDKLAMAGEFVIKVTKFGGERMDASYKDAFENALTKVNAATKAVLQETLEASKKVTQVKHSIDIQPANQLQEGIMGRIADAFKGFLSRLDKKVDAAAKAVEDFISLVADNVPGGEDVDDTPNPVLEGANSYGMPGSSVVKEKKSGGSKSSAPKAPKAAGEAKTNPFEKKEKSEDNEGEEDIDTLLEQFKELSKEGQMKLAQGIAKHLKPKEKKENKKEVDEELVGGQKKLDKDGDGEISGDDFKMMKKEAINPAQQAAIAISKKENVKEELGMRTKEVPNEHAGKYFVKGRKTGENVKSGFDTQDAAIEWGRKNMRQAEWSVHKHKDTKRVYTKD
jgi:hypothetical protein